MNTKRAKRVLKEVLEDKKDNLIKLKLDLYYRLTMTPKWEEQKKQLEEERNRMVQELRVLNMTGGKTTKTKEKIINFEQKVNKINGQLGEIGKGLAEPLTIVNTFHIVNEFVALIEETIESPEILDVKMEDQIKKFKEK